MPYHRFKVGQTVVAPSGVRDALIPRGPYVIVRLLPPIDDEPHYRVKSAVDGHERALLEFSNSAIGARAGASWWGRRRRSRLEEDAAGEVGWVLTGQAALPPGSLVAAAAAAESRPGTAGRQSDHTGAQSDGTATIADMHARADFRPVARLKTHGSPRRAAPFRAAPRGAERLLTPPTPIPRKIGSGPWLGLASEPAGNRHVTVLASQGKHGHDFDPGQMHADRASAWSAAW